MSYTVEYISRTLKEARERHGLSQRALSRKAGVPQSHISKIESGTVDLRLSSLIELARVLDLELTLVPRKTVPAVQSIVRSSTPDVLPDVDLGQKAMRDIRHFQDVLASVSKTLPRPNELEQIKRRFRDLQHFPLTEPMLESIRSATKTLEAVKNDSAAVNTLRHISDEFRNFRNLLAHGAAATDHAAPPRPAYSLDEDDDNA